jgi:hypothetical protein
LEFGEVFFDRAGHSVFLPSGVCFVNDGAERKRKIRRKRKSGGP